MKRRNAVTKASARLVLQTETTNQIKPYHEAVAEFIKHCQIKGLSSHTIDFYVKELKQTRRAFAEIDAPLHNLRQFQTHHIEQLIEHHQALGRAVSTINSRLRASRTFFSFCLRKEYVTANPHDGVNQLKARHEVGPTFTKRQLKKLLDAPDLTTFIGLRDLTIMLTLAHTGIRLTELTSLCVQDVSFDGNGSITVQRAKNRYARRIPLRDRLKTVLHAYMEERGVLDTDTLFISVENKPFHARSIQDRMRHYGMQTGVGKEVAVSPHAFRRTFCRLKVEAGTNIFVLQRLTGHQSLEILRRYVEIYGRDLEEAIEQGFDGI
ncbi:tyrosine-type recombinase/integrase [Peribacillus asahii]|uniref:tyrosine-type recombinase/integrase n=1 Tax=Peribacillus asahii TaxID=228899 RepID=UPI00207AEB9D|nr:tyrosine-type recombinase/integrase [Peribacillus asahii]USK69893.1 tyrosine-type recombinase/integrase [Peribacillus asahii]